MKDYRLTSLLVAVSFAIVSTPAHAQEVSDVRCLLASNLFAKSAKDPNAKVLANRALHFYLGRIDGRFNQDQLRAELAAPQAIMSAKSGATMRACVERMQRSAKLIQSVGQQLARQKQ